ncbi:MAG TPA: divalent metal cation transporter, partial [Gaiellaceae bacterium]|nr:divalent metal cation transporter [Gaiellaceae bacterium]
MELRLRLPRLPRGRARLRPRNRFAVKVLALLAFLGPGIVAANAGNDAGGIATYSSVGAKYGYDLLWMMALITVSLIVVQEMSAR